MDKAPVLRCYIYKKLKKKPTVSVVLQINYKQHATERYMIEKKVITFVRMAKTSTVCELTALP